MSRLNHKGFTLLEAIASITIVTMILTLAATIITDIHVRTVAEQQRIAAMEAASLIRVDLSSDATYAEVSVWLAGTGKTLTSDACDVSPFACRLFTHEIDGVVFGEGVTIVFLAPTTESQTYRVIWYVMTIEYGKGYFLELEGILYDPTTP